MKRKWGQHVIFYAEFEGDKPFHVASRAYRISGSDVHTVESVKFASFKEAECHAKKHWGYHAPWDGKTILALVILACILMVTLIAGLMGEISWPWVDN